MRNYLLLFFLLCSSTIFSADIKGVVSDTKSNPLAYSSILVKGTTKGTTANAKGEFLISLNDGNYIIVCQHIGYKTTEKKIRVSKENQIIDFQLEEQQYDLNEVVIRNGGENPAYEIIRNAIKNVMNI